MIDESSMYWLTRMDHICEALTAAWVLCVTVGGILIGMCLLMGSDIDADKSRRVIRVGVVLSLLSAFLLVGRIFVPTTKEMAAIKIIPAIANNETLRKDASEMYGLAREWMSDTLKVKGKDVDR